MTKVQFSDTYFDKFLRLCLKNLGERVSAVALFHFQTSLNPRDFRDLELRSTTVKFDIIRFRPFRTISDVDRTSIS